MTALEFIERAADAHRQGYLHRAIAEYEEALRVDATLYAGWFARGCALATLGNHATALESFQRALALAPHRHEAHHNLANALFALGLVDQAVDAFRAALASGGGFVSRTALAVVIPGCPQADNQTVLTARREWAQYHLPGPPPTNRVCAPPAAGRLLRVGYLSSFFGQSKWMKPVWGLLNAHDRGSVEIHLFSDGNATSCQPHYRPHPQDRFHEISGLTNVAAAALIERNQLDLLVDLNGFSRVDRLAVVALKPAPVVVGWFNYYATSGLPAYDYLIGDHNVIPPLEEPFYVERIRRVDGCYLTFEVTHRVPAVADPPALTTRIFTFGCLASAYKITDQVVAAWSRILHAVPASRLFLKNAVLGYAENRAHLTARFARHGVDSRRLHLEGPVDHFEFLAAYQHIDIALDTFPYNGGTTTMEALWQGVPVITFAGDRWAARQSNSLLRAAGLSEFVSANEDDYVDQAIRRAQAPGGISYLTELRQTMRNRLASASVCDTAGFARAMESLYATMIREAASLR